MTTTTTTNATTHSATHRPTPVLAPGEPGQTTGGAFDWQQPTRVVFGAGTFARLGAASAWLGQRALLVTDPALVGSTAIVTDALTLLATAGVEATVVTVEPGDIGVDTMIRGVGALRADGADLVVGLGGGSSMDVAKTVALAARNPWLLGPETWSGTDGLVVPAVTDARAPFPLLQVPTTASTGSEVNCKASIRDAGGDKRFLYHTGMYARVALVDPELTRTVPPRQTAEGAVETITRALWPSLAGGPAPRPLQDRISESIIRTLLEAVPRALRDPDDLDARTTISHAVVTSMLGWHNAGQHLHSYALWYLGNALGTRGATKGASMGALLPGYLAYLLEHHERLPRLGSPGQLAQIGRRVFDLQADDETALAVETARVLVARIAGWGVPVSLRDLGMTAADVDGLVDETQRLWGGNPDILGWLDREDMTALFGRAL